MRPVVLTFVRVYLPGYRAGGPIRTIANMVERLGDELEFRIVTSDRDIGDVSPYPGIQRDTWVREGKGWVYYLDASRLSLRRVAQLISGTPHGVVYLNSYFDRMFTLRVLVSRYLRLCTRAPLVLAPRGEFSPGALGIKPRRKRAFIWMNSFAGVCDDVTWQASSSFEAADIRNAVQMRAGRTQRRGSEGVRVVIAPDLVGTDTGSSKQQVQKRRERIESVLSVCFISRISPKKNLEYALRVVEQVRVPLHFAVYGPIEDPGYWARCRRMIASMPRHVQVSYKGHLEHSQVVSTLRQHDLFLFPTLGENFGHVIHEALRAGLVLLISDQTPWRNLVREGVGWDLPLGDESQFVRCIEDVARWEPSKFEEVAMNGQALAAAVAGATTAVEQNRQLFRELLA